MAVNVTDKEGSQTQLHSFLYLHSFYKLITIFQLDNIIDAGETNNHKMVIMHALAFWFLGPGMGCILAKKPADIRLNVFKAGHFQPFTQFLTLGNNVEKGVDETLVWTFIGYRRTVAWKGLEIVRFSRNKKRAERDIRQYGDHIRNTFWQERQNPHENYKNSCSACVIF